MSLSYGSSVLLSLFRVSVVTLDLLVLLALRDPLVIVDLLVLLALTETRYVHMSPHMSFRQIILVICLNECN